jgi:AcrR family transcriptional regulator
MSDIIDATRIQKGGIYRHFDSKDAIVLAACEYALQVRMDAMIAAVQPGASTVHQLKAICETFLPLLDSPALPGGCPILNFTVESDDTDPVLKSRVQKTVDGLRLLIQQIVADGKARGEIRAYVNGDTVATLLIATCEGALMLGKLYDDRLYLTRAIDHLTAYFESLTQ